MHRLIATLTWLICAGVLGPSALAAAAAEAAGTQLIQKENRVVVQIDGKLFGEYYFAGTEAHPYVRPYMYPVLAPDGTPVTSDQIDVPKGDHPHHRSFWVSHGDV